MEQPQHTVIFCCARPRDEPNLSAEIKGWFKGRMALGLGSSLNSQSLDVPFLDFLHDAMGCESAGKEILRPAVFQHPLSSSSCDEVKTTKVPSTIQYCKIYNSRRVSNQASVSQKCRLATPSHRKIFISYCRFNAFSLALDRQ